MRSLSKTVPAEILLRSAFDLMSVSLAFPDDHSCTLSHLARLVDPRKGVAVSCKWRTEASCGFASERERWSFNVRHSVGDLVDVPLDTPTLLDLAVVMVRQ